MDPITLPAANRPDSDEAPPLFIDLDGALLATDPTWEALLDLARTRPALAWRIPLWYLRGRDHLRGQLADRIELDAATLPYRTEVVAYLDDRRAAGQEVVLMTATDRRLAGAVARHLGYGPDALTDAEIDGSGGPSDGSGRLRTIRERCGPGGAFDYLFAGRSAADDPVAAAARRSIRVGGRVATEVRPGGAAEVIPTEGGAVKPLIRAVRPHQWAKNVLLFVPVVTAHRLFDPIALGQAFAAFVAFCLAASSGYLFNDLLDLKSDRLHHSKRRRPLASGRVSIPVGILLFVGLLGGSLAVAGLLSMRFLALIVFYLALTTSYSFYLKRKLLVDVICLGSLYTLRIFAGGVATSIVISTWLLAFSMFIFLSLAFVKRYTEVVGQLESDGKIAGRGYYPGDLDMIRSVGATCGGLAVLVVCLYINSPDVTQHYRRPELLWLSCPIFLYWITRIWFLAQRREMNHDPVVFALGDRISYLAGAILAVIIALAI